MKNILIGILIILILGAGLGVGLLLVNQQAIFKQKAATPTGTGGVSIQPATSSFERNTPYPISIFFNTHSISVSDVTVRLTFSNLSAGASNIQISPTLLSDGSWSCPVKTISTVGSTTEVDIKCVTSSDAGYSNSANTLLATFNITATQVPVVNPLIVSFDPQSSIMTQKSDGSDILLTPASTGSYTITDTIAGSPTASPLIVVASSSPTPLGTINPTITPIPTATASGSATPIPTQKPIPVTSFDAPTIIAGAGGVLLLIFSAAALIL